MAAPIVHAGAVVLCSHGGRAVPNAAIARVRVSGQPVVTLASAYAISGCALAATGSPICVTGRVTAGAARVLVEGLPLVLQTSSSACVPTGTPLIFATTQSRALAT